MSKENRMDTLHHAAIRVKNVKETVEWYTKRFRCEVEYQDASWAMLAFENVRLAFVIAQQHPPHIAILVGSPPHDKFTVRVVSAGSSVRMPSKHSRINPKQESKAREALRRL